MAEPAAGKLLAARQPPAVDTRASFLSSQHSPSVFVAVFVAVVAQMCLFAAEKRR
jgi:hypothetical protein